MKKITFITKGKNGYIFPEPSDNNYILLYYLVSDHRGKYAIQDVIDILEKSQRGEIVWEDFIQKYGGSWDFGNGYGELDIEDGTAYLISTDRTQNPSMSLPLQELIDIFKEWYTLWVKHDK